MMNQNPPNIFLVELVPVEAIPVSTHVMPICNQTNM